MATGDRILITGGHGFVGQQIFNHLRLSPHGRFPMRFSHHEYPLTDRTEVQLLFKTAKPDVVVHVATSCKGQTELEAGPATFWRTVLESIKNVIDTAAEYKVRRVVMIASVCQSPCVGAVACDELFFETRGRGLPPLEFSDAKKCAAWAKLRGVEFAMIITPQLYGPGDNFDRKGGHILPVTMRTFHEAALASLPKVTLPVRADENLEIVYVDEVTRTVLSAMTAEKAPGPVVMNPCQPLAWATMAEMLASVTGFKGEIEWAPPKPDPKARPWAPPAKYGRVTWQPAFTTIECVKMTHSWFLSSKHAYRHP